MTTTLASHLSIAPRPLDSFMSSRNTLLSQGDTFSSLNIFSTVFIELLTSNDFLLLLFMFMFMLSYMLLLLLFLNIFEGLFVSQ